MNVAMQNGRTLTDTIAACTPMGSSGAPMMDGNIPSPVVYTKPMVVLIDEFSTSAADIFPAMIQDNGRAPLVGHRTNAGGGSISAWPTGFYSESHIVQHKLLGHSEKSDRQSGPSPPRPTSRISAQFQTSLSNT